MRRQTFTTAEAAAILGENPRSFARWAKRHGVEPVRRMRIGRSTVTLWARADLLGVAQLDTVQSAC